jgi:hypothetical protein
MTIITAGAGELRFTDPDRTRARPRHQGGHRAAAP